MSTLGCKRSTCCTYAHSDVSWPSTLRRRRLTENEACGGCAGASCCIRSIGSLLQSMGLLCVGPLLQSMGPFTSAPFSAWAPGEYQ